MDVPVGRNETDVMINASGVAKAPRWASWCLDSRQVTVEVNERAIVVENSVKVEDVKRKPKPRSKSSNGENHILPF